MWRWRPANSRTSATLLPGCVIAATSLALIAWNGGWRAPPRFDGAGYAVLARALVSGQGYRAIDHPDRPLHAHFPPGYPLVLALTWIVAPDSLVAAHCVSCVCTVGATLAAWCWLRRFSSGPAAFILAMALAANWLWVRTGNALLSEPLYLLLEQLAVLAAVRVCVRPNLRLRDFATLSVLLAGCCLTRQVAVGIVLAVVIDLAWRRRKLAAIGVTAATSVLVVPWLAWLATTTHGAGTQAGLLARAGALSADRLGGQVFFYMQRIPDQVAGPIVEVATRFQSSRSLAIAATVWAAIATSVVGAGWSRMLSRPRRRLASLIPLVTLAILFFWPFTEAGRFLIPLVPFILVGAVEGLTALAATIVRMGNLRMRASRRRLVAAGLLLAASLPYTVFMLATGRARALEATHRDFDAACDWLARQKTPPGPVISRHPGEVFLRTGRQGLEVASAERPDLENAGPESIARTIAAYHVAYLLIDNERYAFAPASPLEQYVARRADRVRLVWGKMNDPVLIFEVNGAARP
jgi:Dolichyl-phosphate-mannose-protein mannosyltransferase